MNTRRKKAKLARNLQPDDSEFYVMFYEDTFRDYMGYVDDNFAGRLLRYRTPLLPRVPQASAYIQKWALTENSMLLFTGIEWKFELEAEFPGVTAWIKDCLPQVLAYRASTPQFRSDGKPISWVSRKEHLNDDSWLEWRMLYDLASPFRVHRLTAERRAALRIMDWPSAKELIQFILDEGETEMLNLTSDEFDFTA